MTHYEQVKEFWEKYYPALVLTTPALPEGVTTMQSFQHITEEFKEMVTAYGNKDLPEFADGLIDLVYVVFGLAVKAGIPFDEIFDVVHQANMEKIARPSSRGAHDMVKPDGWIHPDIAQLLDSPPIMAR